MLKRVYAFVFSVSCTVLGAVCLILALQIVSFIKFG